MIRFNFIHTLVSAAIIFSAIGCGDSSASEPADEEFTEGFADDGFPTDDDRSPLERETELACEAFCDAGSACPGALVPADCVSRCVSRYTDTEYDHECVSVQIDLLNCYSALTCDSSPLQIRRDCADALLAVDEACDTSHLREVIVHDDEELEVVRIAEAEWEDIDRETEETESTEDSGDDETEDTEDTGPFILPELPYPPELPEVPEIGPVFDFP